MFYFYEALAEFIVAVMLSALSSYRDFFQKHRAKWAEKTKGRIYLKSSMGDWVRLGSRLAQFIREFMVDESETKTIGDLFSNPPVQAIEALSSEELWKKLDAISEHRNAWKGHTGIIGDKEAKTRLEKLEEEFENLRPIITNAFSSFVFVVRQEELEFRSGIHQYNALDLRGYQSDPFPERFANTKAPMESGEIYFLGFERESTPIKLIPLVKLMSKDDSGKSACYFYSSKTGNKCRYVSYHFEELPEMDLIDIEVQDALDVLMS
jgi:hypothetical protein